MQAEVCVCVCLSLSQCYPVPESMSAVCADASFHHITLHTSESTEHLTCLQTGIFRDKMNV